MSPTARGFSRRPWRWGRPAIRRHLWRRMPKDHRSWLPRALPEETWRTTLSSIRWSSPEAFWTLSVSRKPLMEGLSAIISVIADSGTSDHWMPTATTLLGGGVCKPVDLWREQTYGSPFTSSTTIYDSVLDDSVLDGSVLEDNVLEDSVPDDTSEHSAGTF